VRILILAEARLGAGDSGAERVLDGHVAGLAARGHDVVVAAPGEARAARDRGRITLRPIGWSALTPWRARRVIAAELARGIDAVVLHHPLPGALALGVARRAGVRVIAVVHSPWHEEYEVRHPGRADRVLSAVRRRVERSVLHRVDRVCALSGFMGARVAAVHGLPSEAIRIVPGGVDRDRFAPVADRRARRARLGLPDEAPVLFCLRNLEPRMGIDVLLDAMPAVLAAHPGACLVIGGRGPLAAALQARASALGLGGAVRFVGFVAEAELPAHYAAADVFVLPTQHLEGFGLVTLESLACGTPVVGTRVGATPELLEPLDPLLLTPAPSADAIARAVVAVLARRDRATLAARCRAHTARYAWPQIAERLEAVARGA
jgi:glycosyltransferase involved in cell wall biosynthesis